MSNEIVRVDHEALEQVTGKFQAHAQATNETVSAIQRAYDPLKNGGWIGQGASAFYAEMDEKILPAMRRLAAALAQAGKTTAEIRALMRSAEEDASAHFRSDGGGGSGEATSGEATSGGGASGADNGSGIGSGGAVADGGGSAGDGATGGGSTGDGSTGGGSAANSGSGLGSGLPTFDNLDWNDSGSGSGLGMSPDDNYYYDDAGLYDGSLGDGSLGDGSLGESSDYTVPADWLSDVYDAVELDSSLSDYWADDYMVPQDWLSPVMDGVAQDLSNLDEGFGVNDLAASGMDESSGMGSGGGGGGPTEPPTEPEAEAEREPSPASSGGGSGGGGNTPLDTNFGSRSNSGIFPFVSAGEGTAAEPTAAPARFHYQATGGGAVTVPERTQASFVLMEGGSTPAVAQTPSGPKTPLIMALASPLLALLGRAVKNKMEER